MQRCYCQGRQPHTHGMVERWSESSRNLDPEFFEIGGRDVTAGHGPVVTCHHYSGINLVGSKGTLSEPRLKNETYNPLSHA